MAGEVEGTVKAVVTVVTVVTLPLVGTVKLIYVGGKLVASVGIKIGEVLTGSVTGKFLSAPSRPQNRAVAYSVYNSDKIL